MPDIDDATLARIEASIRATAADIVAGFEREHVTLHIAIAICGVVVGQLLDQAPRSTFDEFIAALEYRGHA